MARYRAARGTSPGVLSQAPWFARSALLRSLPAADRLGVYSLNSLCQMRMTWHPTRRAPLMSHGLAYVPATLARQHVRRQTSNSFLPTTDHRLLSRATLIACRLMKLHTGNFRPSRSGNAPPNRQTRQRHGIPHRAGEGNSSPSERSCRRSMRPGPASPAAVLGQVD